MARPRAWTGAVDGAPHAAPATPPPDASRRRLALGLLAVAATGSLAGCGGGASADEATTLRVTLSRSADAAEGEQVLLAADVDGVVPGSSLAYRWQVVDPLGLPMAVAGDGRDIVSFTAAQAGSYGVEVEVIAVLQAAVWSSGPVRATVPVAPADRPTAGDVRHRLQQAAAGGTEPGPPDAASPAIEPGLPNAESTLVGSRLVGWQHPAFRYTGDVRQAGPLYPDLLLGANGAVDYGAAARGSNALHIDFETDAPALEILTKGIGPAGRFRLVVDGRLAATEPVEHPANGALYLTRVTWASAQRRQLRLVGIAPRFGGVRLAQPYRVDAQAGPTPRLRVMFVGDSITEGPAGQAAPSSFAPLVAEQLGLRDAWISGVGGTGYLAAPAPRLRLGQRLDQDVLAYRPHAIVIATGISDRSQRADRVAAEAAAVFDRIQAALPETLVYVSGPIGSADLVPAALNTALRGAVQGRAHFTWVPLIEDRWLTGTGNVGAPNGSGNCDRYLSADTVHPTPEGIRYLAQRWSEWLRADWAA